MKVIWDVKKVWRRSVAVGQASTLEVGDVIYAGYRVGKSGTGFVGVVPNVRQARDARYRRRNAIAHSTVEGIEASLWGVTLTLGGIPVPVNVGEANEVCVVGHESGGPWWWRY